jgi:hypothetical protein
MAGSSVIGALRVDLSANTVALEKGLTKAQASIAVFSAKMVKQMALVGSAIAAAMGPALIGRAIKNAIDLADELGKMAQKIGIPVEQLSALRHAADLADVSLETLGAAMNRFNRNLGDIATGKINDAARALDALGISALDAAGKLRPQTDILLDVADKFASYEDGANKSALAMALFGKSGAELIPLLNAGANGIKASADEARRFGLIVDQEAARAAEEFNDNLTRLQAQMEGLVMSIAQDALPELNRLVLVLNEAFASAKETGAQSVNLADTLRVVAATGLILWKVIEVVGGSLMNMGTVLRNLAEGDFTLAFRNWQLRLEKNIQALADIKNGILAIAATAQAVTPTLMNFGAPIAEFGLHIPQAVAPAMKSVEDLNAGFKAAGDAARLMLDDLFAALTQAVRVGTIGFHEFGQKWKQVTDQQEGHITDLATTTSEALTTIFEDNKTAAIASAIINTLVAVTKALSEYPPPVSFAMAGLQAAMGMAQVAKIRSTSSSSRGGSVSVSGGGTAAVAQQAAADEQQPTGNTLFVKLEGSTFNREAVEQFVEQLREFQSDGGRLVINPT